MGSAASALLRRSLAWSYPVATKGEGAFIWDEAGRKYLDFSGSAAVNFIGHGVREVVDAMLAQARELEFAHSSQFVTRVAEEFSRELLQFAGPGFTNGAVFLTCGGSEAIESAVKLARQYQVEIGQTQRYRVISRRQSYHGATLGALAISGNVKRREMYLPMVREFGHINTPYCYRCHYGCNDCARRLAAELEEVLGASDQIAAFVFEPVSGATLGAAVPPAGYLQRIAEICSQHGVLLIADEVMTGMGRTGRNFAVDHWGVVPDIIVAAKGLSSGYAPLGAVIAAPRVVEALASGSGALIHGFTYNAHPICAAAGRAVLKIIREQALVEKAAEDGAIGRVVKESLASLTSLPVVGDVRGIGLLWGVELMRDKTSKAPYPPAHRLSAGVAQHAAARGLAVYPMQGSVDGYSGDHLLIAPPAVLSQEQAQWAVENLRGAIQSAIQD